MRRLLVALVVLVTPVSVLAQTQPETIEYYGMDMIGSIRIVFDVNGTVLGRQDYAPFGRPLFIVPAMPKEGFGGNERDDETQKDYFHARMFEAKTGRFSRVDPLYANLFEPQAWNRYIYSLNNPLKFIDPDGLQFRSGVTKDHCADYPTKGDDWFKENCPAFVAGGADPFQWNPLEGILSIIFDPSNRGNRGSARGQQSGTNSASRAASTIGEALVKIVDSVPWDQVPAICDADSFTFVGGGGRLTDGPPSIGGYRLSDVHYSGSSTGWHVAGRASGGLVETAGHRVGVGVLFGGQGNGNTEGLGFFQLLGGTLGVPDADVHAGLGLVVGYGSDGFTVGYYGDASGSFGPGNAGGGAGWTITFSSATTCAKK